jgi:hypothetical protein
MDHAHETPEGTGPSAEGPAPDWPVFEAFATAEEAAALAAVLAAAGVPHRVEEERVAVDGMLSGKLAVQRTLLLVPEDRHDEAQRALEEHEPTVPDDHFLHDFDEAELRALFERPDEWSETDLALARTLMAARGIALSGEEEARLREARRAELRRPDPAGGLVGGAYAGALLGGIFGIALGHNLATGTKTTPYGDTVPHFDEAVRAHGRRAKALGGLVLLALAAALLLAYAR